ncbi:MAG: HD-GYP domain-containing protein [Candidatus Xenobia bacterium]
MVRKDILLDGFSRVLEKINRPHVDFEDIADEVLSFMMELFEATRGEIVVLREDANQSAEITEENGVRFRIFKGYTDAQRAALMESGILLRSLRAGVVARHGRVVVDAAQEESGADLEMSRALDNGSWMNHVLEHNGRVVAIVHLAHQKAGHFQREEGKELKSASLLVATALNISRLWENERRHVLDLIKTLNRVVEAKDEYTAGHVERVRNYSVLMCGLLNLSREESTVIETAAYLHDIGKVGISDHILKKTGPLTPEEKEIMMEHVPIGERLLDHLPMFDEARRIACLHHEYVDGSGYGGTHEIPVGARIISIADAWDALTTTRPYRKAMAVEDAILVLTDPEVKQWDRRIVQIFIEHMQSQEFLRWAHEHNLVRRDANGEYDRDHSVLKFKSFHDFYHPRAENADITAA